MKMYWGEFPIRSEEILRFQMSPTIEWDRQDGGHSNTSVRRYLYMKAKKPCVGRSKLLIA